MASIPLSFLTSAPPSVPTSVPTSDPSSGSSSKWLLIIVSIVSIIISIIAGVIYYYMTNKKNTVITSITYPTVNSGDKVSLNAPMWVATSETYQTFIYASADNNWLGTNDKVNVLDIGKKLDEKFLFEFQKCSGSGPINYGDRVNIKSKNRYLRCAAGTCSSGFDAKCGTGDWEVFIIKSSTGQTGPVYIGDIVLFQQEATGNCNITPAGGDQVYCQSNNDNNNYYIQIRLPNGTNGESASASQTAYASQYQTLLEKQNPTLSGWKSFISGKNFTVYIILIIVFCMISSSVVSVITMKK